MKRLREILKSPLVLMTLSFIFGMAIASTAKIVNGDYGFFSGLWPVILGASAFMIMLAYGNAIMDAAIIKAKGKINHPIRFLLRALAAAGFSLILLREFSMLSAMLAVYQGFLFWLVFDSFLSLKRGRAWDYLSTWYKTSWLDKIFNGNTNLWLSTKAILFLGSLLYLILS